MTSSTQGQRRLIWHGMFLFLLGLLIGLAHGTGCSSRRSDEWHIPDCLGGGVAFCEVVSDLTTGTYWTVLYGTYANVIITTFAAVVGANSLSPITGVGHNATPWQESLVTVGFWHSRYSDVGIIGRGLRRIAVDTIH
jgi:hydroxylaminobenzene mutase